MSISQRKQVKKNFEAHLKEEQKIVFEANSLKMLKCKNTR